MEKRGNEAREEEMESKRRGRTVWENHDQGPLCPLCAARCQGAQDLEQLLVSICTPDLKCGFAVTRLLSEASGDGGGEDGVPGNTDSPPLTRSPGPDRDTAGFWAETPDSLRRPRGPQAQAAATYSWLKRGVKS
ncbi:hypothetical protein NQZ68_026993 [Dissostichus eleginoides]|nr:hypothetical protein NQZ68_026993 [Dissostichus eleginoides]